MVDRQAAAEGGRGYRAAPLSSESLSGGKVALQVFIDRGCVEAYINNGEQVMSSFSYPVEGPGKSILLAERGTMEIESLTVHRLRGIGLS
ncbi:MAG: GH32 C-terminal domain-containing protein [Scardovia wiggsiae]